MEFLVVVALAVIIAVVLGFVGFLMAMGQRATLAELTARLDATSREIAALSAQLRAAPAAAPEPRPAAPEPAPAAAIPPIPDEPPPIPAEDLAPATLPEVPPLAARAAASETLEEKLAYRWMLWVGAVALALGGAFLVKYMIDQGWFGPTFRCLFGFLAGCALMAGGEWLRRRPPQQAIASIRPNYVPPALTAAGVSIAYTSAYAAFELYDLLPPLPAFIVLGILSMGAVFLSLLQGPLVALLGVIGGFVTPLLVETEDPSTWGLFIYLSFLIAAALAIVRYTAAWWLGQITLAGAAAWLGLCFLTFWQPGEAAAVGTFLILLAVLAFYVPSPSLLTRDPPIEWEGAIDAPAVTAVLAALLVAVFLFVLLRMESYGTTALVTLALFAGLCFLTGFRAPWFDTLPVLAGVLTIVSIAAWHLPEIAALAPAADPNHPPQPEVFVRGHEAGPIVAPPLALFLSVSGGFGALFGAGGFALLWRARRPAIWGAVSAAVPVLLFAVAYWRIEAFGIDVGWAMVAAGLAVANVLAAARARNHSDAPGFTICVGAYAAAAVAAISLGATMLLREAWLTVALSLQLPALAWIGGRLGLTVLRPVAMVVACAILVRLIVNPDVLDYQLASTPLLNWMLYGYGIPVLAFFGASISFRRAADDALVAVLEAGALVFATILVTLEIHDVLIGPITQPREGLLEPSLQSIAWLTMAIGIALNPPWTARPIFVWARNILAGAAVAQIVLFQVLDNNPLWSGDPVGTLPIVNDLLFAYGIPAGLLMIFIQRTIRQPLLARIGWLISLVLVFIDVSLEVRHGFQGPVLSGYDISDAEWYCYSAAWLGLAGVLLVFGIRSRSIGLRYGSMGVLLFTVGKVFLFDMAALTGLYRAASFAGLGFCLIGVGYIYQRFVLSPRSPEPKQADAGA